MNAPAMNFQLNELLLLSMCGVQRWVNTDRGPGRRKISNTYEKPWLIVKTQNCTKYHFFAQENDIHGEAKRQTYLGIFRQVY